MCLLNTFIYVSTVISLILNLYLALIEHVQWLMTCGCYEDGYDHAQMCMTEHVIAIIWARKGHKTLKVHTRRQKYCKYRFSCKNWFNSPQTTWLLDFIVLMVRNGREFIHGHERRFSWTLFFQIIILSVQYISVKQLFSQRVDTDKPNHIVNSFWCIFWLLFMCCFKR